MPPDNDALDGFVHRAVTDWRQCDLSPALRCLLLLAEKLTRTPAAAQEADLAELREAGWKDEAILDAVQVIAYFNYINRVAQALGALPEDGLPIWGEPEQE
ncbi:MAG: hypothetical protein KKB50_07850 [Planctomycetes bacterium]|nr:hypothetical protein [Planctomycetota bacterium]